MAQFETDFSEYTTGVAPSDWTQRWNTIRYTPTVQASSLPSGTLSTKALRIVGTSDGRYALTWDTPGSISGDVEVLCRIQHAHTTNIDQAIRTHICTSGIPSLESAYFTNFFVATSPTTVALAEYDGGTATNVAAAEISVARNTWYWVRLQKSSTTIQAKVWAHGESEPSSWSPSGSDSSLSSGSVGFGRVYSAGTLWSDFFSVGTGGDSAPSPSSILPHFADMRGGLNNDMTGGI